MWKKCKLCSVCSKPDCVNGTYKVTAACCRKGHPHIIKTTKTVLNFPSKKEMCTKMPTRLDICVVKGLVLQNVRQLSTAVAVPVKLYELMRKHLINICTEKLSSVYYLKLLFLNNHSHIKLLSHIFKSSGKLSTS